MGTRSTSNYTKAFFLNSHYSAWINLTPENKMVVSKRNHQ